MDRKIIKESIGLVTESNDDMLKQADEMLYSPDASMRAVAFELFRHTFDKSDVDRYFINNYPLLSKGEGVDAVEVLLKQIYEDSHIEVKSTQISKKDIDLINAILNTTKWWRFTACDFVSDVSLRLFKADSLHFYGCKNVPADVVSNDSNTDVILASSTLSKDQISHVGAKIESITIEKITPSDGVMSKIFDIRSNEAKPVVLEFVDSEIVFGNELLGVQAFYMLFFSDCSIFLKEASSLVDNKTIKSLTFDSCFFFGDFIPCLKHLKSLEYILIRGKKSIDDTFIMELKKQIPNVKVDVYG